ncbi:phosphoserine phosphatase, chloroplastic isoform X2 [Aristolochia californica]|uniref:phosphoserine phosphatase, chloroplastic isoform X2 n=1 Tax=Aristolochia californica TaxID=171875 RepID=UPI0035E0B3EA
MEGLMINLNSISVRHNSDHCSLPPTSTSSLSKGLYKLPFRTMRKFKASKLVVTSAQAPHAATPAHVDNSVPNREVLEKWRNADAVCFDVDSTVCLDEGIDELAEFCGAGKAVAEWTARAMGGSVPFEDALAARLSLFKPSISQLQDFLERRPPKISPGIDQLIRKLQSKNINVYLVSGGFRQMIKPVALQLGISPENIFANQLLFGSSGEFSGFDKNEPTSRSGGKATAVQDIRKAYGYKTLVMIGDGATDLEVEHTASRETQRRVSDPTNSPSVVLHWRAYTDRVV